MGGTSELLISQLIGVGVAFAWAFPVFLVIFFGIKKTIGLRVSREEEIAGLDITEHGAPAYHGFIMESGREGLGLSPIPTGSPVVGRIPSPSSAPDSRSWQSTSWP